ncbi:MAG TPA: hypothetical protein VHV51_24465 [Polyangiaceae bacterium]|jgi:hypothetical protein|nr:hypothetical protein [Polyangiaceae bacterium]
MSEPGSEDDEREDDFEDEEEEESPPPPKTKAKAKSAKTSEPVKGSAAKPALISSTNAIAIAAGALIVGAAAGWFGQIQQAKAHLRAEVAAAPAGSGAAAGPCGAWQSKICTGAGAEAAACQEAKAAAELLLPSTCETALGTVSETLAKVKAGRASCDKLVSKLCADLPPGSSTCEMVKQRTPSFPRERCDQMLGSYDKVIAELKRMDEQGGMPMGGGMRMPGGMRPSGMTPAAPGAAPPGMPHITLPSTPPHP